MKSNENLVYLGAESVKQTAIPGDIGEDENERINKVEAVVEVVVGVFKHLPFEAIIQIISEGNME